MKEVKIGMAYSTHGDMINAYENFVGKLEGKRSLERLVLRCEDNIKMDLNELIYGICLSSLK
jgi:hypothetical protein